MNNMSNVNFEALKRADAALNDEAFYAKAKEANDAYFEAVAISDKEAGKIYREFLVRFERFRQVREALCVKYEAEIAALGFNSDSISDQLLTILDERGGVL